MEKSYLNGHPGSVPTSGERERIEAITVEVQYAWIGRRQPSDVLTDALAVRVTGLEGPTCWVGLAGEGGKISAAVLVLVPFVGAEWAVQLASDFALSVLSRPSGAPTIIGGTNVYAWLVAMGVVEPVPSEWGWPVLSHCETPRTEYPEITPPTELLDDSWFR